MTKHFGSILKIFGAALLLSSALAAPAQNCSIDAQVSATSPFTFVAYGDARFHEPADHEAANPPMRQALVKAIAALKPAFVTFTGDIVYDGDNAADWKIYDSETAPFRDAHIPVLPALGNHDLHGNEQTALRNYFARFPSLHNCRYYSARIANIELIVLDSALDETSSDQGEWLKTVLQTLPADVDFVFVAMHHPPYTSSSDKKEFGGGHSARPTEQKLASLLEERQKELRARIVVFSGHVHNYERHEHGGITYFVTGGAGAHAYPIPRAADDPFQSKEINYHYLTVEVGKSQAEITMHRLQLDNGVARWSEPDRVTIPARQAFRAVKK